MKNTKSLSLYLLLTFCLYLHFNGREIKFNDNFLGNISHSVFKSRNHFGQHKKKLKVNIDKKINVKDNNEIVNNNINLKLRENPHKNLDIVKDPNIKPNDLPFDFNGSHSNFLGLKVPDELNLFKPPFQITRCDQTINFETEYIPNFEDYSLRLKCKVTINAYHIHLFNKSNDLIGSILQTQSSVAPNEPRGAKDCIMIDGNSLSDNILICFTDVKIKENILEVFDKFRDCRASTKIDTEDRISAPELDVQNSNDVEVVKECSSSNKGVNNFNTDSNSSSNDEIWTPHSEIKVPGSE